MELLKSNMIVQPVMKTARTSTSLIAICYQQCILQEHLRDATNITSLAKYDFIILKIWYHDNSIAAINQKKFDNYVE